MAFNDLYGRALRRVIKVTFPLWDRMGFHITPKHFYQPIPDLRGLPERLWTNRTEMAGVDMNEAGQLALLAELTCYKDEYTKFPRLPPPNAAPNEFYLDNDSFESVDAEVLYSMVRRCKPQRMIEIGSGSSTYLSALALRLNAAEGHPCDFTAIEPYPESKVPPLAPFPGLTRLIVKKVQDVPLREFEALDAGCILFIDSSHVLTVGSDVQYEFLEIVPRLKKGVLVHVHDIFFPAEYPRHWVMQGFKFFAEQYLLQAFLAFNDSFEVLWAGSWMHINHAKELVEAFPSYNPRTVWPGSFWMRRVK